MTVSSWASELLARHQDILTRVQVDGTQALIDDGEGWLAAYDLFRDGIADGWLTVRDLREAEAFARAGAFSKFSADVERLAADALAAV